MTVILTLRRQRQDHHKIEANLARIQSRFQTSQEDLDVNIYMEKCFLRGGYFQTLETSL